MFNKTKKSAWPWVICLVSLSMIGMASITSKGKRIVNMMKSKMKSCCSKQNEQCGGE